MRKFNKFSLFSFCEEVKLKKDKRFFQKIWSFFEKSKNREDLCYNKETYLKLRVF